MISRRVWHRPLSVPSRATKGSSTPTYEIWSHSRWSSEWIEPTQGRGQRWPTSRPNTPDVRIRKVWMLWDGLSCICRLSRQTFRVWTDPSPSSILLCAGCDLGILLSLSLSELCNHLQLDFYQFKFHSWTITCNYLAW